MLEDFDPRPRWCELVPYVGYGIHMPYAHANCAANVIYQWNMNQFDDLFTQKMLVFATSTASWAREFFLPTKNIHSKQEGSEKKLQTELVSSQFDRYMEPLVAIMIAPWDINSVTQPPKFNEWYPWKWCFFASSVHLQQFLSGWFWGFSPC